MAGKIVCFDFDLLKRILNRIVYVGVRNGVIIKSNHKDFCIHRIKELASLPINLFWLLSTLAYEI